MSERRKGKVPFIIDHFRHILLFYYLRKKTPLSTLKKIQSVYGNDVMDDITCRKWIRKFRNGNYTVEDALRNGRTINEANQKEIENMIKKDRRLTTREICHLLKLSGIAVSKHLRRLGILKKVDTWVPRQMSEANLIERISSCDSFLNRNKIAPFLKQLVTGNQMWIPYGPSGDGNADSEENSPGEMRKFRLCVWWDYKGVMYFELLRPGIDLDECKYCSQLDNLKAAIALRRPALASSNVVFYQEDGKDNLSLEARQKMITFGWEVLMNPQNSPDLAPTSYHLFNALQCSLKCVTLEDFAACHKYVNQFFLKTTKQFYKEGIARLPERWKMVIEAKGAYIDC